MNTTISVAFRTKEEAKVAVKAGQDVKLVRQGEVLDKANGVFTIRVKLDHYKAWEGKAHVWGGVIERIT